MAEDHSNTYRKHIDQVAGAMGQMHICADAGSITVVARSG